MLPHDVFRKLQSLISFLTAVLLYVLVFSSNTVIINKKEKKSWLHAERYQVLLSSVEL